MVNESLYEDLKQEIETARSGAYNLVVVSIPGMGGSYLLRRYVRESQGVKYIARAGEELGEFNIVDLPLDLDSEMTKVVDGYSRNLTVSQKMVLLVNIPYWLRSEEYQKSYLRGHVYKTFWLRVTSKEELGNEVYKLSGGLPQLVKYLKAGGDEQAKAGIVEPIMRVIWKCNDEELTRLGVKDEQGLVSEILRSYQMSNKEGVGIQVNFDLSFEEDGQRAKETLSAIEAEILRKIVTNGGKITKEEVSDIKWGEGKYDQFSDQAINKAMRRLKKKLERYVVVTVPKVGYKVEKRSG